LHIILDYENGVPIYEQIKVQIREQILSGKLKAGEALPSIRVLAKEMQIGIITAKRAYDELAAEGFTYSVQGKGIFVSKIDRVAIDKIANDAIAKDLTKIVKQAKASGFEEDKLIMLIHSIWDKE
jgi:GntR family transcriptional regulator